MSGFVKYHSLKERFFLHLDSSSTVRRAMGGGEYLSPERIATLKYEEVAESIQRNLEEVFSRKLDITEDSQGRLFVGMEERELTGELKVSICSCGIPSYTDGYHSFGKVDTLAKQIERELKRLIRDFEPRLSAVSVRRKTNKDVFGLTYQIRGQIQIDGAVYELPIDTQINTSNEVAVRKNGAQSS